MSLLERARGDAVGSRKGLYISCASLQKTCAGPSRHLLELVRSCHIVLPTTCFMRPSSACSVMLHGRPQKLQSPSDPCEPPLSDFEQYDSANFRIFLRTHWQNKRPQHHATPMKRGPTGSQQGIYSALSIWVSQVYNNFSKRPHPTHTIPARIKGV